MLLYNALVRSHLEYNSLVWSPLYYKYINRLESVQRKFLFHLNYRFNRELCTMGYEVSLKHHNLLKLCSRRNIVYITFLHRLFAGCIDCKFVLEKIYFSVPQFNFRSPSLFYVLKFNTNSAKNSPLCLLQSNYNNYLSHIDIFNNSLISVKTQAMRVFSLWSYVNVYCLFVKLKNYCCVVFFFFIIF